MNYNESNKRDILISKIITGITIVYLFSFIIESLSLAQHTTPLSRTQQFNFSVLFAILIKVGLFCFQIFLIARLIYPKKAKINFINFERGFHPFFIDSNQESELSFRLTIFVFFNFVFLLGFTLCYFNFLNYDLDRGLFLYNAYIHLMIIWSIQSRNKILNSFPLEFMKINKLSLRMNVKYEDYINHKIVDDEPHLKVNQFLMPLKKEYPRTSEEKETIELRNYETPANPALVTKIVDFGLSKIIDDGYDFKVRVVAIKDFGELEIEMWLDDNQKK
jgi:hypothetical protein